MLPENPLVRLERHSESTDYILRQVGYCAKWSLDNYCKYIYIYVWIRIARHTMLYMDTKSEVMFIE